MTLRTFVLSLVCATSLTFAACGKAELGETCDTSGSTDECVDGAVCDTEGDEKLCFATCTDDTQCAATENCTGVSSGNSKRCKTK